ncbi:SGNH/GDSL hydrolase family protein [Streptomyces boncukensis]|uniref:SGNH/GDSL hydrolase family protein n=1 Tax=Streptomyces boncukensis TaxID=2711219 RepID=A0A6G4X2F1_9ACTN|nr:SGNH/GDSL hydrolase family protein [Streptomyces boncukensis]NGO71433.1 SGNH/GDSL hydrolase family protein [Streptomyces boncukensis]
MNTETAAQQPLPLPRQRRRRRRPAAVPLVAASACLVAAAVAGCGTSDDEPSKSGAETVRVGPKDSGKKVLWLGDSIAGAQAPPLAAALKASGVQFKNAASDGGGTVVEGDKMSRELAADTWKRLAKHIRDFRPNVIAYQLTTYDWGSPRQQQASYEKLARTARDADAELVLVTTPPFKIDDFYEKYADTFASAPKAARRAAGKSGGHVRFLDASQLWGSDASAAKAQRAKDGIHSCQQGSASFAQWFTKQLGDAYGFTPAPPQKWANTAWTGNKRYAKLGCE